MEYFKSINQEELIRLIKATRNELYLCLPSLHIEVADALNELVIKDNDKANPGIKLHVLIDFDQQTFRQGYGEFDALSKLFGIITHIRNLPDNRISFIISDNAGFFLFIESRSLIPADKETINAVKIDPVSIVRLKNYFFPDTVTNSVTDELSNAIIEESKQLSNAQALLQTGAVEMKAISFEEFENVKADLERNKPIKPDFKRIVEFYSTKFQYVDLHFDGQNFRHATITIPSKLLPYKNETVRNKMITKLKLFENIAENPEYQKFSELEQRKKEITAKYLTTLSTRRGKNILKRVEKEEFESEIKKIKLDLTEMRNNIYSTLSEEIKSARKALKQTMLEFLLDNPTDDMIAMGPNNHRSIAEDIVEALMRKLITPDPMRYIRDFKIETTFSDITYEDLRDKDLLSELKEKGLIDEEDETSLADFGEGIKIKRNIEHTNK